MLNADQVRDATFYFVIAYESGGDLVSGGDHKDPNDPGKRTKFGLAQADHPDLDFDNLELADAKAVYLAQYWKPMLCDQLPWPLAPMVFDTAVNEGRRAATLILQVILPTQGDGIMGPGTVKAATMAAAAGARYGIPGQYALAARFMAARQAGYEHMAQFDRYGRGWEDREALLWAFIAAAEVDLVPSLVAPPQQ